jgi:hypothetical protein
MSEVAALGRKLSLYCSGDIHRFFAVMLSVVMLGVVMLGVVMLGVVVLGVVVLKVVAPKFLINFLTICYIFPTKND